MKTKKNLLLLLLLLVLPFTLQAETFNVKKYGARGNGKKMDSPAIQKAIDACHKAGGGTVLVPAGTYLSATIVLKDNVTLHLEKDALILGTTDYKAYDNLDPFTEGLGIDVGWALLVAVDAKNVALEGYRWARFGFERTAYKSRYPSGRTALGIASFLASLGALRRCTRGRSYFKICRCLDFPLFPMSECEYP